MRKIKFRVWDGNLMHNVSELHFCMGPKLDGNGLKFYGPGVGQGWIDGENVHLMQYTGLKDKNGKEIYEGDILECTSELLTNFGKTKTGRYETTYKQVIWLTDSWGYRVLKSKHIVEGAERKGLEIAIKFGVICGNIYENPELLER